MVLTNLEHYNLLHAIYKEINQIINIIQRKTGSSQFEQVEQVLYSVAKWLMANFNDNRQSESSDLLAYQELSRRFRGLTESFSFISSLQCGLYTAKIDDYSDRILPLIKISGKRRSLFQLQSTVDPSAYVDMFFTISSYQLSSSPSSSYIPMVSHPISTLDLLNDIGVQYSDSVFLFLPQIKEIHIANDHWYTNSIHVFGPELENLSYDKQVKITVNTDNPNFSGKVDRVDLTQHIHPRDLQWTRILPY